jgi:hypothetical protein
MLKSRKSPVKTVYGLSFMTSFSNAIFISHPSTRRLSSAYADLVVDYLEVLPEERLEHVWQHTSSVCTLRLQ